MSAFGGFGKIEFTYSLRQDSHGVIVSVQWLMKNQIYVPPKAGQIRRECQYSVVFENLNYVLSKVGQPRLECQRPGVLKNRIHVQPNQGQPSYRHQYLINCDEFYRRAHLS